MTLPDDGDAARADRIEGVLLGAACGDALGVPYEFGSAPLGRGEVPRMIGGGLGPYAPGEWSDDTQMAVVIAQVAAEHGLRDGRRARPGRRWGWLAWLRGGASDVGNQTPVGARRRSSPGRPPGRRRTPGWRRTPCTPQGRATSPGTAR